MRILLVNKFFFRKGGSEMAFFDTAELLEKKGHQVIFFSMKHPQNFHSPYERYFVSHIDLNAQYPLRKQVKIALRFLYSLEAKQKISALINDYRPELVHLHNFHHQISPSILSVFKKHNLPVVVTLHDYKLVCPIYTMFTEGKTCEACRARRFYWCLWKRCVKGSILKSALSMLESYLYNNFLRIHRQIDIFISPSRFLANKLREMGFPRKMHYLPNFIDAKKYEPVPDFQERSVVYFGRLSYEKGLVTLIEAAARSDVFFKIIGDGPLKAELQNMVSNAGLANVKFYGYMSGGPLKQEVQKAMAVIVPADWYENNPRAIIEAYALGKPVIGSNHGGIPELIVNNETGVTFTPHDSEDLARKVAALVNAPARIKTMGITARAFVENNMNPEQHYQNLLKLYELALARHR